MSVRAGRANVRQSAQPAQPVQPTDQLASFPAPTGGWIANTNLAAPNARKPDGSPVNGAAMLVNWRPTATGISMRGGSQRYAIVSKDGSEVTALFDYKNGNIQKLFAAT